MILGGESSQHDLVTFALYGILAVTAEGSMESECHGQTSYRP